MSMAVKLRAAAVGAKRTLATRSKLTAITGFMHRSGPAICRDSCTFSKPAAVGESDAANRDNFRSGLV
jgi:hypothetical protein